MTTTVLETLSPEDLERWRVANAAYNVMQLPGFRFHVADTEKFQQFIHSYYELAAELLEANGVGGAEAVEAKISPFTGAIFIGEGE